MVWIAGPVLSAVYLAGLVFGRRNWLKVTPALVYALALAPSMPLAAVAFLACALGDALLLNKERYFLHGLGAFLVGHGLLVPVLWSVASGPPTPLVAGLLALAAGGALAWMWPHLRGKLRIAVPVYTLALGLMVWVASAVSPLAAAGASLFLVSDAILGANRFVRPFPRADLAVMITYYSAIGCLCVALLNAQSPG